jgi:hypothetical protein
VSVTRCSIRSIHRTGLIGVPIGTVLLSHIDAHAFKIGM